MYKSTETFHENINYIYYFTYFHEYSEHPFWEEFKVEFEGKIKDKVEELRDSIYELQTSRATLRQKLLDIDNKIFDLLHYVNQSGKLTDTHVPVLKALIVHQLGSNKDQIQTSVGQIDCAILVTCGELEKHINSKLKKIKDSESGNNQLSQKIAQIKVHLSSFHVILCKIIVVYNHLSEIHQCNGICEDYDKIIATLEKYTKDKIEIKLEIQEFKEVFTQFREVTCERQTNINLVYSGQKLILYTREQTECKYKETLQQITHMDLSKLISQKIKEELKDCEGFKNFFIPRGVSNIKYHLECLIKVYTQQQADCKVKGALDEIANIDLKKLNVRELTKCLQDINNAIQGLKGEAGKTLNFPPADCPNGKNHGSFEQYVEKIKSVGKSVECLGKHFKEFETHKAKFDQEFEKIKPFLDTFEGEEKLKQLENSRILKICKFIKTYVQDLISYKTKIDKLIKEIEKQLRKLQSEIETFKLQLDCVTKVLQVLYCIKCLNGELRKYISNLENINQKKDELLEKPDEFIQKIINNICTRYFLYLYRISYAVKYMEKCQVTNVCNNEGTYKSSLKPIESEIKKLSTYGLSILSLDHLITGIQHLNWIKQSVTQLRGTVSGVADIKSDIGKLGLEQDQLVFGARHLESIGHTLAQISQTLATPIVPGDFQQIMQKILTYYQTVETRNKLLEYHISAETLKILTSDKESVLEDIKNKLTAISRSLNVVSNSLEKYLSFYKDNNGNNSDIETIKDEIKGIENGIDEIKTGEIKTIQGYIKAICKAGNEIPEKYTDYTKKFSAFKEALNNLETCLDYLIKGFLKCSLWTTVCRLRKLVKNTPWECPDTISECNCCNSCLRQSLLGDKVSTLEELI